MNPSRQRGLHVALLGIDGIGKSTLAEELRIRCTEQGIPTSTASWRRHIDAPPPGGDGYPTDSLQSLYFEIFRLFCGGATIDGGARTLPASYAEFAASGGGQGLDGASITGVRPSGPLAATLLEVAGNILFHREVVRPLVESGQVVIEESYGYKHVVKDVLYTARVAPGSGPEIALIQPFVREFFGTMVRPDVGIHLHGEPALAERWRTAQSGATGRFEALPAAGDTSGKGQSFLDMQAGCAEEFTAFATAYGWRRVDLDDAPRQVNHARAMNVIDASPLGELLARRPEVVR